MKENLLKSSSIKSIVLIVVLCGLFIIPLFLKKFPITHDSEPQLARMAAVTKAIYDGHVPPRWASELNYTYGLPSPNFFFPLNGYLGTLLYAVGFTLQTSYKLLLASTFIFSSVFFYLWCKNIFDNKTAIISALLYGLAPYHFLNVYVRGQVGEMLGLTIAPLVLFFLEKNIKNSKTSNIIFISVTYALLITSHNITGLIFSFIFAGYIVIRGHSHKKNLIACITGLGIGLMLSTYFWFPALYEGKYINSHTFVTGFYKNHFANIIDIVYSTWGFGSNISKQNGLSPQIGPIHISLVLFSLAALLQKPLHKKTYLYFLTIFLGSIFFMTSYSSSVWERFHMLQQFQFPWRLASIASFTAAILGGFALKPVKNNAVLVIITSLLLATSIPLAQAKGHIDKTDKFYFLYPGTGAYHGESTTIWTAGDAFKFPQSPVEVISGKAVISNYMRKTHVHSYYINAETNARVIDNTTYFPGWTVYVNGEKTDIEFQDINHRGLITFEVPKGIHSIQVIFEETKKRTAANSVSLGGFMVIVALILLKKRIDNTLKS